MPDTKTDHSPSSDVSTLESTGGTSRISTRAVAAGKLLSGLVSLFLLFDGGARMVGFAPYIEGTVIFGYPEYMAFWIGLSLLASTILYLIPRTAVLGAILVTGYLGGAVASQVRMVDPWFAFPLVFGILVWLGLYLRDARIRALLPLTSS